MVIFYKSLSKDKAGFILSTEPVLKSLTFMSRFIQGTWARGTVFPYVTCGKSSTEACVIRMNLDGPDRVGGLVHQKPHRASWDNGTDVLFLLQQRSADNDKTSGLKKEGTGPCYPLSFLHAPDSTTDNGRVMQGSSHNPNDCTGVATASVVYSASDYNWDSIKRFL